jgi:uncharacterized membrane protein
VGRDFQKSLPLLFPQPPEGTTADDISLSPNWESVTTVVSRENGYLQRVDEAQLMSLAMKDDIQIRLKKRPGDFVARDESIFDLSLREKASERLAESLRACLSLGVHRTPHQDPLYSLQQLVEIAVHALSPGINEPFTALVCIDWLGTSLRGIAERTFFPSHLRDSNGKIRIMVRGLSFDEVAGTAMDQIRLYGANNPEVMTRLLQMIAELAPCLKNEIDRAALTQQARLIGKDAFQIKNEDDRKAVSATLEKALRVLTA